MKNVVEMREELAKVFNDLRDKNIDVKVAGEMNNAAGKMINSLRVELEYNRSTGKTKPIPFLDS